MKQYKIDAFKGYEKFIKKIGRKEGYICYISWSSKNTLTVRLSIPGFLTSNPKDIKQDPVFFYDPSLECDVSRFDPKGNEVDMYKETYDTMVRMHNDFRRMKKAFKEKE
jgi:hypothetical protein